MSRGFITEDIREIHFYRGGTEVTPGEVFEDIYSSLSETIEISRGNFGTVFESRKNRAKREVTDGGKEYESARKVVGETARNYSSRILFDDGSDDKFSIQPRTNYPSNIVKTPNILFLSGGDTGVVLREAREYEGDEFIGERFRKKFKGKFKERNLIGKGNSREREISFLFQNLI